MLTGHRHLLRAFAEWLNGGPAPETVLDDNVRSLAGVFAARASTVSGTTVRLPLP
jgi:hypothetical protein